MTPTNELRFVERNVQITDATYKTVHILQQKWENPYVGESEEWRDVPVEKEEKQ